MTTEVIGQLPCPECNTTTGLKSDGRKYTLKCPECGMLAYYQSQNAKNHIEMWLDVQGGTNTGGAGSARAVKEEVPSAKQNAITLQLPEMGDGPMQYKLTIEPLGLEPIEGEMTTFPDKKAANDEEVEEEKGFFEWLGDSLL